MFLPRHRRIYLDHAATTPVDRRVLRAMNDAHARLFFNPGGLYAEAVQAARLVSDARASVAGLLGTTAEHVVFTRGGTESNNLAILGAIGRFREVVPGTVPHVIVSEIEHPAVIETARFLQERGEAAVTLVPVGADGIIDLHELKRALRPETVLVSVMYVNNEIGTIQPVREITKLVRWYRRQRTEANPALAAYPLVHTDAIQAANYLDLGVDRLGVDLMSLSGSKIYGPKSSGVLYARNRNLVSPVFHGGEQEFGLRAGTEDAAQIIGFARALGAARACADAERARLTVLRDMLLRALGDIPGVRINGSTEHRICNNVNLSVAGIPGERLVIELDAAGILAASRSACREDAEDESHVIAALRRAGAASVATSGTGTASAPAASSNGPNPSAAEGSVRLTMGRGTTARDIRRSAGILSRIITDIREFEGRLFSVS